MSEMVVDGKLIKKMLIDRDMTGRELARRIGVHEQTITYVINGGSWSHHTVNKIANVLECNPIDLLMVETETA